MPWVNQYFRLVGEAAEMAGHHLEHAAFNPTVAIISLAIGGTGWLISWLIYGRKPLVEAVDPIAKPLGPVYTLLQNKYYFDELYHLIFIRPTLWLADASARFDSKVIDGIVNAVGQFGRWLASWLRKAIDNPIIDGIVNGVGKVTTWSGEFMRATQTGKVQNYLLVAAVTVLLLLGLFLIRG
jgi:NADH-quinone oxidoreductase subunit L